jgi:hypothetical protein
MRAKKSIHSGRDIVGYGTLPTSLLIMAGAVEGRSDRNARGSNTPDYLNTGNVIALPGVRAIHDGTLHLLKDALHTENVSHRRALVRDRDICVELGLRLGMHRDDPRAHDLDLGVQLVSYAMAETVRNNDLRARHDRLVTQHIQIARASRPLPIIEPIRCFARSSYSGGASTFISSRN